MTLNLFVPGIPVGLCQCGCGGKTNISNRTRPSRGLIKGRPVRFISSHPRNKNIGPDYKVDSNGCWIWNKSFDGKCYGRVWVRGSHKRAHRFYYEKFKGSIPEGLEIDHLCRVMACVNPDHLEPVTHTENVRRGSVAKITMAQANEIRSLYQDGFISLNGLAWAYGISKSQVQHIIQLRKWRNNL